MNITCTALRPSRPDFVRCACARNPDRACAEKRDDPLFSSVFLDSQGQWDPLPSILSPPYEPCRHDHVVSF